MKIHFDNVNFGSQTGPNTFATRLARKLFESGHEVTGEGPSADVSLIFIERSGRPLAKKVVQRLDGIWFKPADYATKNSGIRSTYDFADAVVWQSEFDMQMTTKWFDRPRIGDTLSRVIHNGIEVNPVKELTIPALVNLRSDYKKMYVCSANWHPQKRLRDNIALYKKLRESESNSCLIILGHNPDVRVADPHIFYAGSQPAEAYNEIYAAADWMLHLAWADHCPNVVVEALAQGTPVICSTVGGTKEIVGSYGLALPDVSTSQYNYELYDYDNPPEVDLSAINVLPSRTDFSYDYVKDKIDINNTCKQYVDLFNDVINKQ